MKKPNTYAREMLIKQVSKNTTQHKIAIHKNRSHKNIK